MPVGSTLQIGVFTDLNACDPVTVYWGDGASVSKVYGGSLAENFEHTYNATGTYTISATEPCGGQGQVRTINVSGGGLFGGGGLGIFDPSNPLFAPTLFGLLLGLIALGLALGNPRIPGVNARPAPRFQRHFLPVTPTPITPTNITPTRIVPTEVNPTLIAPTVVTPTPITPLQVDPSMTTLPSMVANLVSYQDIPPGAPQQDDPRLRMKPGQATDLTQLLTCACGGRLGYVAGGWFCLNPACPLRHP